MADVDAYQEDEEDLEEEFTNLVDMQKQVEEWVCHSGADEEQQKVAKDWKEAAETLLWKVEKLEADTGTKQDRAIARLKLHWCLSTIYSNVEELHDQGCDTAVSQDKHKPGAVKNLQDILLGVVDIGQDYDDEVLQLDAVEALALLHSTTCYFEDLSKALATSFALYPTKDKALAFLRSIEEQDVNNIFVRVSNWANIAGDLVEFDSPWCHRWYPEYVHIYFWLVENAGARREELVKRDLSHCLQRGANATPQRFYRALQLAMIASYSLASEEMENRLLGVKVLWEASELASILQSHENACILASKAAKECHALHPLSKLGRRETREISHRLERLRIQCSESNFHISSSFLEEAELLYSGGFPAASMVV